MNTNLADLSICELAPLVEKKGISPVELVEACLNRIESTEGALNAYITTLGESALEQAKQAETEIVNGSYRGPLHGIPFSVKDLYATKGVRTTAGSKIYLEHVPDYDATTVARLKYAGAILLGKNNTHEFASGGTNENAHFGPSGNPWDPLGFLVVPAVDQLRQSRRLPRSFHSGQTQVDPFGCRPRCAES